jgi:CPA2 family monovalent cation:H+ antiporter-2
LGQIGEFSFILAGLGVGMGLLPPDGRDLILAGAILSILLNPFLFTAVQRGQVRVVAAAGQAARATPKNVVADVASTPSETSTGGPLAAQRAAETTLQGHDVVVGYGRVGSLLGRDLAAAGRAVLVFEERQAAIDAAVRDGAEVVIGNAADPEVLGTAQLGTAQRLFVTIAEAFEAGQVVQQARTLNPNLEIIARAHSDAEVAHLDGLGADLTVMGEREIAYRMIERARLSGSRGTSTEAEAIRNPPGPQANATDVRLAGDAVRSGDH